MWINLYLEIWYWVKLLSSPGIIAWQFLHCRKVRLHCSKVTVLSCWISILVNYFHFMYVAFNYSDIVGHYLMPEYFLFDNRTLLQIEQIINRFKGPCRNLYWWIMPLNSKPICLWYVVVTAHLQTFPDLVWPQPNTRLGFKIIRTVGTDWRKTE